VVIEGKLGKGRIHLTKILYAAVRLGGGSSMNKIWDRYRAQQADYEDDNHEFHDSETVRVAETFAFQMAHFHFHPSALAESPACLWRRFG
jgi:hypothetical protein